MSDSTWTDSIEFEIPNVVSLSWNVDAQAVLVVWTGRPTAPEFQALLEAELRAFRGWRADQMLADLRLQPRLPSAEQDRPDREWLPEAIRLGLSRFGVVLPHDPQAAADIQQRLPASHSGLEVSYFNSIDEARRWLARSARLTNR
jgi:hypothetical protein